MMIDFAQIPEKLHYPKSIKGQLSSLHSDIVVYATKHFDGSYKQKSSIVRLMNTISYFVLTGDSFPAKWSSRSANPFENIELITDNVLCKDVLGDLYLNPKDVNWDIEVVTEPENQYSYKQNIVKDVPKKVKVSSNKTDKSDLYIQPSEVPQFDPSKPWASGLIGDTVYCIYSSVPEIPTKQNEISVTTDVDKMSDADLLNLFPKQFIPTRSPVMYNQVDGIEYHDKLGLVLPIDGYTYEQRVDNIVRYPHLFKLMKEGEGSLVNFYSTIEIEGELKKASDVWKEMPDTSKIPYTADFVKEYVVRRYLLERDIDSIHHIYSMNGSLDPFLTLFTTPEEYRNLGYLDAVSLARQCVLSRVMYKRSRNPVIRRLQDV